MPRVIPLLVMVASIAAVSPAGAQPLSADLLERMRVAVERFREQAPSLVGREEYLQIASYGRGRRERRRLVSELLMVRLPGTAGWISFRDVLSVDAIPVEGRERRLLELLQSPQPDSLLEARRIANESARFNLGRIKRTINVPDMALEFLRAANAHRMRFEPPRADKIDGTPLAVFRFRETGRPTVFTHTSGADLPATGRVWVEVDTGAVVRTELTLADRVTSGTCVVDFGRQDGIAVRVPTRMTERYRAGTEEVEGVAMYSGYRQFSISTTETVRKPPPGF